MTDHQRIFVVSTEAAADEVARLRARLARSRVVLTAPTGEARRIVEGLGSDPVADVTLAPVRFPPVDRGHRLDDLVRRHAVADRMRDVVVVADPATNTLLLRVLAPDQLADGTVVEVGLPRGSQPVSVARVAAVGLVLALVAGLLSAAVPWPVLPGLAAIAGLVLLAVPRRRHVGQTLLLATAAAALVTLLVIAGSARFPGTW